MGDAGALNEDAFVQDGVPSADNVGCSCCEYKYTRKLTMGCLKKSWRKKRNCSRLTKTLTSNTSYQQNSTLHDDCHIHYHY